MEAYMVSTALPSTVHLLDSSAPSLLLLFTFAHTISWFNAKCHCSLSLDILMT